MAVVTLFTLCGCGTDAGTITWLSLSTLHKFIWRIPVLRDELTVDNLHDFGRILYTRQIYVNVEIAFIGLLRRCILDPPEFIKAVTSFLFLSGVAVSFNVTLEEDSIYYRVHDAFAVVVISLWFYQATKVKA